MVSKLLLVFLLLSTNLLAQNNCEVSKVYFNDNEEVSYHIQYKWGLIWANAGEAKFTVAKTKIANKDYFHFKGEGNTYPSYDWLYKVRDKYESYVDPVTFKPLRFFRDTDEGGKTLFDNNQFYWHQNKVISYQIRNGKNEKKDTTELKDCVFDVLTSIYQTRCINFDNISINQKIPISMYLDNEIHDVYLRYLGVELLKTENYGMVNCIKFSALLIEGTIFRSGESMTVWVTNDENRIPVYVETKIFVGKVKVWLKDTKNLKKPMKKL